MGASALNYIEVNEFLYDGELICGVKARDVITNKSLSIKAKKVVSAAGPWVDHLRNQKEYI